MSLDFSFGFGRQGTRQDPGTPCRILVIADFTGRGSRGAHGTLAGRRPRRVDLDDLESVLAAWQAELRLSLPRGETLTIRPRSIDDLHPDALFDQVDAFRELRSLRAELSDPRTFARAAAALRGGLSPGEESRSGSASTSGVGGEGTATTSGSSTAPAPGAGAPGPPTEGARTDLERLLGARPAGSERGPAQGGTGRSEGTRPGDSTTHRLHTWIEGLVAPHIVPERDPTQDLYVLAVDDTIGDLLRWILHHPAFQALEAAWRSTLRLVQDAAQLERTEIWLLDATLEECARDLAPGGGFGAGEDEGAPPSGTPGGGQAGAPGGALATLFSPDRGPGDAPWSWLVVDGCLGTEPDEIRALAGLVDRAAALGTAVVAAGSPALVGISSWPVAPRPADWPGPRDALRAAWDALRARGSASHLAVAVPRVLLRLPYGKSTDPIERLSFEEWREGSGDSRTRADAHGRYLWGSAAYALALAGAFAAERNQAPITGDIAARAARMGSVTLTDLPVHVSPDDGGPGMQATAEVFLTEGAAEELDRRGFTALVSVRNSDRAQVFRLRAIR